MNLMTSASVRHVARIILLDQAGNVLLVRYEDSVPMDPDREGPVTYWVPPGGALDQDENHRSAAVRELQEETGLVAEIGPWLWECNHSFLFKGKLIKQQERFYLVRLETFAPPVSNLSPEAIVEHRWWSLPELQLSSDIFFPEDFVRLVAPIINGELPSKPLRI